MIVREELQKLLPAPKDILEVQGSPPQGFPNGPNRFSPLENCTYGVGNDMFFSDDDSDNSESVSTEVNPIYNPPPSIHLLSEDPRQATEVKVKIQSPRTGAICAGKALLDSGATGMFMDPTFAKENGLDI